MKNLLTKERLPVMATALVCILLYTAACLIYKNFFSLSVFVNFISDNAFLGIVAVGLTFVILTGGIDLSVGAMVGCAGVMSAKLIQDAHLHPLISFAAVLAFGTALGVTHGILIQKFALPPFLVTLGGLFLCRGISLAISKESIQVDHPFFNSISSFRVPLGFGASVQIGAILFLLILAVGIWLAKQSRFGRTVYAIGGNEQSALLMGLNVPRTKVLTYALSGFLAALGGLVFAIYTSSGNPLSGTGMELDAIAAVVIGGTLLSGGYGSVFGSFLGVMILGIIQTAITFQGNLSSWWTKIVIGALLLGFMLIQKLIERATEKAA